MPTESHILYPAVHVLLTRMFITGRAMISSNFPQMTCVSMSKATLGTNT